jgi:hypothetical protein
MGFFHITMSCIEISYGRNDGNANIRINRRGTKTKLTRVKPISFKEAVVQHRSPKPRPSLSYDMSRNIDILKQAKFFKKDVQKLNCQRNQPRNVKEIVTAHTYAPFLPKYLEIISNELTLNRMENFTKIKDILYNVMQHSGNTIIAPIIPDVW